MAEWEEELGRLDLCVTGIHTMAEALASPLFQQRQMAVEVLRKDGTAETALGVPIKLSETPGSIRTPCVQFGESTVKILEEYGYSPDQIKALQDQGVI